MITLAHFAVLSAYLIVIYKKFGFLDSISHSTYRWEGDQAYYFMAMCWALAFLNLAQGMEGWGVLTSAGLLFTGITIKWMDDSTGFWVHTIGAIVTVLAPFIGIWIMHGIFIPFGIFAMLAVASYFILNKFVYWIEIQAFGLILISYSLR